MIANHPILTLYNRHSKNCGEPPEITNNDRSRYVGYFQNEHGEQCLFIDDPTTDTAVLRSGDLNWDTAHTMHGPDDLPTMNGCELAWARVLGCVHIQPGGATPDRSDASRRVVLRAALRPWFLCRDGGSVGAGGGL